MALLDVPKQKTDCPNFIENQPVSGSGDAIVVNSPYTGTLLTELRASSSSDVDRAVRSAEAAFPSWSQLPLRERIERLLAFKLQLEKNLDLLSNTVAAESGKTPSEARAGILRGIEVIDFAASLANADSGGAMDVSRGVACEYRRRPLGVVVGITPFNFPAMVPMWMFPIALTVGNCFVLKPSEKVPLSANHLARLLAESGYPPGVFSVVHGGADTVNFLVDHPQTRAVGFVGSSAAAASVYARAAARGKRALCLGGAKNQLIAAPDADLDLCVKAAVDSFTGCAGQRCMATSLMIVIGNGDRLVEAVVKRASEVRAGENMGAIISSQSRTRIEAAIERAVRDGAELLLDGRGPTVPAEYSGGNWLGPSVLDRVRRDMQASRHELFGPVLSIVRVDTLDEALAIESQSPYGNATSIFTTSGGVARYVTDRATSGMLGVNVGVPVPREPFSFGGTKTSRFGHGDMTGPAGVEFWSDRRKITSKWAQQSDATWMS